MENQDETVTLMELISKDVVNNKCHKAYHDVCLLENYRQIVETFDNPSIWKKVALLPFMLCVGFLLLLGKLCGLTYKQISVVFNLWVQGAVLMLSGVAPAVAAIYQLANGGSLLWIVVTALLILYAAAYVYGFIKMLQHYHLPFDRAFDLCVKDLKIWAKKWHTTYHIANLLIFIVFYLILLGLNISLTYYLCR